MIEARETLSITVLGLGNPIRKDEGFGIHVAHRLMKNAEFANVNVVDGGTDGLALLPLVEDCKYLLVIDAVDAAAVPGTIVQLSRAEASTMQNEKLSQHQLTFQEVLALARFRNHLPCEIVILGVQPSDLGWGTELTPVVAATLHQVENMVKKQILAWGGPIANKKSVC